MKVIFFAFLIIMFIGSTYAQDNAQVKASVQLSSLLHYNMSRKLLKDTNQVVMFAFRVDVHLINGKYKISKVSASDSIAYAYYPDIEFLNQVDYRVLARNRTKISVIIPVAVLIQYPTKTNPGLEHIDSIAKLLGKYLFLKDEKGNLIDTSDFIYLPLGIIKTTTFSDI